MRNLSAALVAKLASGVTTLAHVWRIERRDGTLFAFTDHDRSLSFDGLTAEPLNAVLGGVIEKSTSLAADSASMAGALSFEAMTEEDLAAGLWDGARVDIYRVDWSDPVHRLHLFAGRIGEVRRGVTAFEAELRGLQAPLNVPVGRVFSRFCDANLGDARCGKNIDDPAFRADGSVAEVLGSHAFRASGLDGFADQWFGRGRIVFAEGDEVEISSHRAEGASALIELLDHPGGALTEGATFTIYAGCDKRLATCHAKFDNVVNFRGFPHMPGNDALRSGPGAGDPLDGGSRLS